MLRLIVPFDSSGKIELPCGNEGRCGPIVNLELHIDAPDVQIDGAMLSSLEQGTREAAEIAALTVRC